MTPEETIKRIAELADAVGFQAGVGGSEVAGQFVSILARHPEHIEQFLEKGAIDAGIDMFGAENGCLTFHRKDGKVTTPSQLHAAREVHKIRKLIDPPKKRSR